MIKTDDDDDASREMDQNKNKTIFEPRMYMKEAHCRSGGREAGGTALHCGLRGLQNETKLVLTDFGYSFKYIT